MAVEVGEEEEAAVAAATEEEGLVVVAAAATVAVAAAMEEVAEVVVGGEIPANTQRTPKMNSSESFSSVVSATRQQTKAWKHILNNGAMLSTVL